MDLDIRTLMIAVSIVTGISAVVLFVIHFSRFNIKGTLFWAYGGLSLALSVFLISARGELPDWLSKVVANVGIFIGFSLLLVGIRVFLNKAIPYKFYLIFFSIEFPALIWCSLIDPSPRILMITASIAEGVITGAIAFELLKDRNKQNKLATKFTGFVFAAHPVSHIIRIFFALNQEQIDSYLTSGTIVILFYLYALVFVFCYTTGLILIIGERLQSELNVHARKLEQSIEEIKKLSGILPICSSCKNIRNDDGYWQKVEAYIQSHSEAQFSHSICPGCAKKLYGDLPLDDLK